MVHKIKTIDVQIAKLEFSKWGRSADSQLSHTQIKIK